MHPKRGSRRVGKTVPAESGISGSGARNVGAIDATAPLPGTIAGRDIEATKAFFIELGLKLEGETTVERPLIGKLIGLDDVRATLATLRTPDGQGIELDKFHTPNAVRFGPVDAPVNTLGIRRIMFAVDDIDAVVARMRAHGAEVIGEMQYENAYRLAYIRGPEGIIVALAEQLIRDLARCATARPVCRAGGGGHVVRVQQEHNYVL